ncbi:G2-specific protein kinase nimA [Pseudocercospora fuligena]|uniref:G2-specific protein kinase nimA n=1 Tax=Pseudocercospora fuligena TaxID=685502 RepID=A0A8H6VH51_9PEZI|nr:G2-specific protein kinase nimA [Pseudocercospora fuligena]
MAAAAPPGTPLQRWQDFNVDLWRTAQPGASLRGQGGVRTGARNAWATLTPATQANLIIQVDQSRFVRAQLDVTLTQPSPLPNAVPDTQIRETLRDFFERGYDATLSARSLAGSLNTIVDTVEHRTVRDRVIPFRDQAQADAATRMAALGTMRGYTRRIRSFGDRSRIGQGGPTKATGPVPTYVEDRDYLDANRGALGTRKDDLQTLLNDIQNEVQTRTNDNNVVPRGERTYLISHMRPLQKRIGLLTHIVEILDRWDRDTDVDDGEPINTFGQEPNVNSLGNFVKHLDNIKGFEEAMIRMKSAYDSRFSIRPLTTGTDVEVLFPAIARCHQQHMTWYDATVPEVDRLRGIFNNHWGGEYNALTANQQRRLGKKAKKALKQREARNVDLSSSWMGPMFLGAGSHGTASIWIKQDAAGRISDRVAVKDTNSLNPNYLYASGVVQPPPAMPMEAVAMLKLIDLPGSSSIVNIRNWRSKMPYGTRPGHRIYMEFCSGGDLSDLFKNHWPRNQNFMPESFLWAVFDSLVTAGLLMEGAHLRDTARTIWDEIIHGDMKPDNVFVGENTSGTFRGFPLVKLGDFGIATIFPKAGLNPADYWQPFSGPGYRAPEMAKIYRKSVNDVNGSYAPKSAANVWGVGMIMRGILHRNPWANLWEGPPNAPPGEPAMPWKPSDFTDPLEVNNYSQRLRDLIMSCLELVPENRPTFKQLRESILAEVGPDGTDPNLARLRDADPAADARFTTGGPPASVDKYAIGLAIDDLPADALPAVRFRDPPAVTSPVNVTVGGTTGALAPSAEYETVALPEFIRSVLSRKRTFDKIS